MSESQLNETAPRFGGCQCGAVRFRAESLRGNSHVCHCRMCQKAVGNFFAALVGVPMVDFTWTRGEPAVFQSSEKVERGFCSNCGTPLYYRHNLDDYISMTTGSFDHPQDVPLQYQFGNEGRLPQIDQLVSLAHSSTTENDAPERAENSKVTTRQHPDHETADWP